MTFTEQMLIERSIWHSKWMWTIRWAKSFNNVMKRLPRKWNHLPMKWSIQRAETLWAGQMKHSLHKQGSIPHKQGYMYYWQSVYWMYWYVLLSRCVYWYCRTVWCGAMTELTWYEPDGDILRINRLIWFLHIDEITDKHFCSVWGEVPKESCSVGKLTWTKQNRDIKGDVAHKVHPLHWSSWVGRSASHFSIIWLQCHKKVSGDGESGNWRGMQKQACSNDIL